MLERLFQKLSPPAAAMAPPGVAEPSSAPATAAVHIIADSGMVRLAEGQLQLDTDAGPERVRFGEIASVSLHGEGGITSPALRELMRLGIPVIWRARSGHYCGQSFDLAGALPQVRRAHYKAADDGNRRLDIAKAFVRAKLVNTRGLLRRRGIDGLPLLRLARLAADADAARDNTSLLGFEGAGAALYFAALPDLVALDRRGDFPFDGRRRRPPTDPLNALLSYLYAVLAGECAAAALMAGLDPGVGFLHAERAGRPALALDLVEPLRPLLADRVALGLVNRGEIGRADFDAGPNGIVLLNKSGRRLAIAALERRWAMGAPVPPEGGSALDYRAALKREALRLATALRRQTPFVSSLVRG